VLQTDRSSAMSYVSEQRVAFHTLLGPTGRHMLGKPETLWTRKDSISPAEKREARRLARIIRASEILKP